VLFYDDFESGLSQWQTNGWGLTELQYVSATHSFTESPDGNYPANTVLVAGPSTGVDLTGYLGATLDYWANYQIETGFDVCRVEMSRDAQVWVELDALTGFEPSWQWKSYDIGGFAGESSVYFRFRFYSDPLYTYDGIYIDDFTVIGTDEDTSPPLILHPTEDDYRGSPDDTTLFAGIYDPSGISEAHLYYRLDGCPFQEAPLTNQVEQRYYFTIPAQEAGTFVEYYFEATDASSQLYTAVSDTFAYIAGRMLIHDDGLSEAILQGVPGDQAAVRFNVDESQYITTALVRIYTDAMTPLDSIGVYVWDDSGGLPGTAVVGPVVAYPANTPDQPEAWSWIDLRPALIQAHDLFHLGFEFAITSAVTHMALSYDQPPVHYRSSLNVGAGFAAFNTADFHIRAVVGDLIPDELLPPTDLSGTAQGDLLHLTWSAPTGSDDLLRYEIERQGEIIGQTVYLETEYTDTLTLIPYGLYAYRVRARYSTGISSFTDPWEFFWDSTGVKDPRAHYLPQSVGLHAYPIPTNGALNVSFEGLFPGDRLKLNLYDLLGREILSYGFSNKTKGRTIQIVLPETLAGGIYILAAQNDYLQIRRKVVYLP
jgi:hypothetical protein